MNQADFAKMLGLSAVQAAQKFAIPSSPLTPSLSAVQAAQKSFYFICDYPHPLSAVQAAQKTRRATEHST